MFGFLRSRKDPLADARSAERWFAAPVATDTLSRKQELIAALGRITTPTPKLTPRRLGALFVMDAHAEQLFRAPQVAPGKGAGPPDGLAIRSFAMCARRLAFALCRARPTVPESIGEDHYA